MVPNVLIETDAAIGQVAGLIEILCFIHDNADTEQRIQMREAEGWLLLSLQDAARSARTGYDATFRFAMRSAARRLP